MIGFFDQIGVNGVDHIAVTTNSFEDTLASWLSIPGTIITKGPGDNEIQKCRFAFVQTPEGSVVEILSPLDETSPICSHLSIGGGAYHFCFFVQNLSNSIALAEQGGALNIVSPVPDVAFEGNRVAFLIHKDHGLFELVEYRDIPSRTPHALVAPRNSMKTPTELTNWDTELIGLINKIFPDTKDMTVEQLSSIEVSQWDSLGQLRLVLEVENFFGLTIPATKIGELNSYKLLLEFLAERKKTKKP